MERRLREIAREFLARPGTLCFLGWEAAPGERGTRPIEIRDAGRADLLVWNRRCHANLAAYLPRFRGSQGSIGIAVKGCDARALRELVRARQIERERLFVVGVPCAGLAGPDGESLARRCHGCRYPEGFAYDATLGPMVTPDLPPRPTDDPDLDAMSPDERLRWSEEELSRCIRCDACRKACYGCFCPECVFEASRPRWISRRDTIAEKLFYHAVRAYHLAGRCVGCDECGRACPAGVRLDVLNRALARHVEELFAFSGAGVAEGAVPPLLAFEPDDPEPYPGGER